MKWKSSQSIFYVTCLTSSLIITENSYITVYCDYFLNVQTRSSRVAVIQSLHVSRCDTNSAAHWSRTFWSHCRTIWFGEEQPSSKAPSQEMTWLQLSLVERTESLAGRRPPSFSCYSLFSVNWASVLPPCGGNFTQLSPHSWLTID